MALDDGERNAEKQGAVESDPLAGQVHNQDLAQLGKERRITSETDTSVLQAKGTVPQLEIDGTAGSTLHVLNDKSTHITLQPGLRDLGLPDTGDPFQKEWVDKNEGAWEGLWRGFKGLFGSHETLADKAKEREIANLTPEQRKQYEKEEKELSEWKMREATMMSIAYQGSPPPDCPMHREVERRVAQFEQGVKDEVLGQMTPEQRRELEREQQEYDRESKEIHAHDNPLGGPLYQREPTPGPTMEYYKKMVQRRAEEKLD